MHSMTNDLKDRDVDEITNMVADITEKAVRKARKVVISTIVNRDDDPVTNAKAEAVNAGIRFKLMNKTNVSICTNENLKDRKFRCDKIHLTDRGVSRLANNLKYKIAGALNITVKKKPWVENRYELGNRHEYEEDHFRYVNDS